MIHTQPVPQGCHRSKWGCDSLQALHLIKHSAKDTHNILTYRIWCNTKEIICHQPPVPTLGFPNFLWLNYDGSWALLLSSTNLCLWSTSAPLWWPAAQSLTYRPAIFSVSLLCPSKQNVYSTRADLAFSLPNPAPCQVHICWMNEWCQISQCEFLEAPTEHISPTPTTHLIYSFSSIHSVFMESLVRSRN